MSADGTRCDGRLGVHVWILRTAAIRGRPMEIWGCMYCGHVNMIREISA